MRFHFAAIHNLVDGAFLQQKFGALEAFGQFSRTVCLDHAWAGKAHQRVWLGQHHVTQKGKAGRKTPPMVGSVSTEIKGSCLSLNRCSTALVLVICISELRPSCIRARRKRATQMKEQPVFPPPRARRALKRSPTTESIEPPIKPEFKRSHHHGQPVHFAFITTKASFSPRWLCAPR